MKVEEIIRVALDSNKDIYYTSIEYDSYQFDKRGIKVGTILCGLQDKNIRTIIISWDTIEDIMNNEDIHQII